MREAYEYPAGDLLNAYLIKPCVLPYIRYLIPLLRICVQYVLYQVARLRRYKFGDCVVAIQDFLVQIGCIRVFEGEIAADHREENDTTAPNVNVRAEVALPCNHLWRSVARGATGCFQSFSRFVGIGEAEIDYLDVLSMVEKQVLGFQISK